MANFADHYRINYDAIVASTKGAAPQNQVMFVALLLTIFQSLIALATTQEANQNASK